MSHALAYALFRIQQHQAPSLEQQHRLHQMYLTFLAGELTPEQYERNLDPAATKDSAQAIH